MHKYSKIRYYDIFEEYDKLAPDYPIEIFKNIQMYSKINNNTNILEIGCGTGKATKSLLELGYKNITGIEIEYDLSTYLWGKFKDYENFNINISSFEDWDGKMDLFDIIISINAFQYINPQIGYKKAYQYLKSNGSIALFYSIENPTFEIIDFKIREVYERFAPGLVDLKLPKIKEICERRRNDISKSEYFHSIKTEYYTWNKSYTSDEYIQLLDTNPSYRVLDKRAKYKLYDEISYIIKENNDMINKEYVGVLLLAKKQ